jgi:hypothetical protein
LFEAHPAKTLNRLTSANNWIPFSVPIRERNVQRATRLRQAYGTADAQTFNPYRSST